ncbi:MAG TPA: helix-turn-helix transcriptional regulator [Acetobacteraceae bacterium]|jgi:DNA-binding transcriptional regulator YiaG|nr:helix-turn-helix transcriptional regulator [Acetobacteraceae bacterium]
MPRAKPPPADDLRERRRKLHEDVEGHGVPVADAIKRMRQALGLTQTQFGRVFKLTVRQVWELEAGTANPTLSTLTRLAKPFGFQPGFILLNHPPNA